MSDPLLVHKTLIVDRELSPIAQRGLDCGVEIGEVAHGLREPVGQLRSATDADSDCQHQPVQSALGGLMLKVQRVPCLGKIGFGPGDFDAGHESGLLAPARSVQRLLGDLYRRFLNLDALLGKYGLVVRLHDRYHRRLAGAIELLTLNGN